MLVFVFRVESGLQFINSNHTFCGVHNHKLTIFCGSKKWHNLWVSGKRPPHTLRYIVELVFGEHVKLHFSVVAVRQNKQTPVVLQIRDHLLYGALDLHVVLAMNPPLGRAKFVTFRLQKLNQTVIKQHTNRWRIFCLHGLVPKHFDHLPCWLVELGGASVVLGLIRFLRGSRFSK